MAIKNDSLGNLRLLNVGLSSHVNDWTYILWSREKLL